MWRLKLALASSLLFASTVWAATTFDFNPVYKKLDLTLDPNNLGNVTGITVATTGLNCSVFASGGALTTDANGNLVCSADDSAGGATHNILSATHTDSVANAVTRGSLIYGNATPAWDELVVGGSNTVLVANATDASWSATPTVTSLTATNTVTGTTVSASGVLQVGSDVLRDITGTGLTIDGAGRLNASGGSGNSFETLAVPAGTNPVADSSTDTLTITETSPLVITGTAASDTLDITWATLTVADGGTGATTLTDGGILLGSGTGAITALGVASNGQIPIGDGTTAPVLATLTGTAVEVDVTNGAGSITIGLPATVGITTSILSPIFSTAAIDPADAGLLRLGLSENICWEENPTGTDVCFLYDALTDDDFEFSNDLTVEDTTPHLRLTDTTASEDDFELYADASQLYLTNVTDAVELLRWDSQNNLFVRGRSTTYAWPTADGTNGQFLTTNGSGTMTWTTSSGSGDVTSVGDCTTGACFDGTQGTTLTFNDASGDQTLIYNVSGDLDFNFSDDVNIRQTSPHLRWIPTTGNSYEAYAFGSMWFLTDVTTGATIIQVGSQDNVTRLSGFKQTACALVESLVAADDNMLVWNARKNATVTDVSCKTSAFTTQPTVAFEDDSGNAMTNGTPYCDPTGNWKEVTAANTLISTEGLRFDTTNTPAPTTGTQALLCFAYTEP